tara:strand:- start:1056 stop:1457 length:402 start_codon:yes stop_codon:yes gene_type:complete
MANLISSVEQYKDLDLSLKPHPLFGDIRPVKDVDAIKNSIKNILLTKRGEKPFNPRFGCNLTDYLFEPADRVTESLMRTEIEYSLGEQEPRIQINKVIIEDYPDRNSYAITIDCLILTSQSNIDLSLILKRLR